MPARSEANALPSPSLSPQPTRRWLWGGALLGSIAIHGGFLAGITLLWQAMPQPAAEPQAPSIPVEFVELPSTPSQSESTSAEATESEGPSAPTVEAGAAIAPSPMPSAPSFTPAPPSDEPRQAEPTPTPSPSASVEPQNLPSPEPSEPPTEPTAPSEPPSSPERVGTLPTPGEALAPSALPELPPTLPTGPVPPPGEPIPDLSQVTVAETVDPVEITASVSVWTSLSTAEEPADEQRDRQTFTYDPTGASGLAIATCPFVPDVSRYAGETVTLQVQLDPAGVVQAAEIYKSSTTNAAYETFVTCLVENWDFSRLALPGAGNSLLVSVTIENTGS